MNAKEASEGPCKEQDTAGQVPHEQYKRAASEPAAGTDDPSDSFSKRSITNGGLSTQSASSPQSASDDAVIEKPQVDPKGEAANPAGNPILREPLLPDSNQSVQ